MADARVMVNLRKGLVEFCVLGLLVHGPKYGLELARRLQADGLAASDSTLYPLLARLHSAGLVESEWRESDAGRPRKYYALTGDGIAALAAFVDTWAPLRDAVDVVIEEAS